VAEPVRASSRAFLALQLGSPIFASEHRLDMFVEGVAKFGIT